MLASLFAELLLSGDVGSPGDRLVNASSRGDLAKVKEILESNPDKVCICAEHSHTHEV